MDADKKIDKLLKKLPTGYAEEADRMSDTKLKAEIIQAETNIRNIKAEQAGDEKLNGAKEIVKDLNSPYNDAVKAQRAKIEYALHLMEQRGTLPGSNHE